MDTQTNIPGSIEPSLTDAAVILPVVRKGKLRYLVHGIVEVGTIDEALDLIVDRRRAPRAPIAADVRVELITDGPVQRFRMTMVTATAVPCTCGQADHTERCPLGPVSA